MEAHMEVVKIVPEAAKVEILVPPVKPHVLIWKHTQSVMFMSLHTHCTDSNILYRRAL